MKLADHRPQTRAEFHERLQRIGAERYHDRHPFHKRLHGGRCSPDEVRAWVVNRWQYQSRIPMKDAAFMSRLDDPQMRRIWRQGHHIAAVRLRGAGQAVPGERSCVGCSSNTERGSRNRRAVGRGEYRRRR